MKDIRKEKQLKGKIIPLRFDYMFTNIFNNPKNIEILENFISCYLEIPLKEIKGNLTLQSRELIIENKKEKNKQVDLILKLGENKINIELNNNFTEGIIERNVIYACNIHGRQLKYGDNNYSNITSLIQINLNASKKTKTNNLIERYVLTEEKTGNKLSKKIIIDVINLLMYDKKCYTLREEKLARWCKVIMTESMTDLKETLGDDLMEERAKETLIEEVNKYSTDDEVVALYSAYSREELERNTVLEDERKEARESGFKEGKEKGIKEGIKDKTIEVIRNMLNEKMDIDLIIKVTGTTKEEIQKITEEI